MAMLPPLLLRGSLRQSLLYLVQLSAFQGSKLTLANSQNAIDFDNLRVRKMSSRKSLRVRIIHLS